VSSRRLDYDLTVVGGGIHGVGVAQAAAAAGLRVVLLEARSLAAGTSSKSSKLIHGGLRYLESLELGLVRESLRERAILLRIAPDLVRLVPFHIPVYRETSRRPWQVRAGLSLYALLANLRRDARFESVPRGRWEELDGLRTDGLQHVFRYNDAQTDDAALVRAVMRSAQSLGAELLMPAELTGAERVAGGYRVAYRVGGAPAVHDTGVLVNAAGPWVELVRRRVHPEPPGRRIDLVQGTHIELPGVLTEGIYYTEAPRDRRAVFTMPWKGRTLVGTTEHLHPGAPEDCAPTKAEIAYLRETFSTHFPGRDSTVLDSWAGLRVLPQSAGSAFGRTRETLYVTDEQRPPHYLAVYGGKLTGYRAAAQAVLRRLRGVLPKGNPSAETDNLPL
jgi:glycerol-3-phosphate dehydrogenase